MIFQQLLDPRSSTFTYLMGDRVGAEALIIDPVYEQVDIYLRLLQRLDLKLTKAIDTHVHADHISGLGALRDMTRCVTVMGERGGTDVVSMRVREGDTLEAGGISLRVLYTPGHTDDSYSFVGADRVFTGDALLIGGTGRTDFQNGDPIQAYHAIRDKLLTLPDTTLVYPGHDYNGNTASTIGYERRHNSRLQVKSAEEYATLMGGLNLPNPKMMDVAVPANRVLGLNQKRYVEAGLTMSAEDAIELRRSRETLFVDLREEAERRRDGMIEHALHLPYDRLDQALADGTDLHDRLQNDPRNVVFFCSYGERSALALDQAREHGLGDARHLMGGLAAWMRAGGPVQHQG
jgi:sulfur dioxygenase